jgi:L-rhamnose-H+ transport protein
MLASVGSGFLTILLAGVLQGSVLTPMPYLRKWSWENTWLIYSIFAYLLLPWPFALWTVPKLFSTFTAVPHETLLRTLVLGFVWGFAVVLYGLGVDMLGLALGTAIILGLGTSVGSLVPLIGQHRDKFWAASGMATLAGVLLLTIAVVLFSVAGKQRERILRTRAKQSAGDMGLVRSGRFLAGLLICILCGLLSPLLNIIFAYSTEIQKQAINHGANPTSAGNAVWILVANGGFLPSFFYCLYLLRKNRSWSTFSSGVGRYWLLTPLMGLMWISCIVLYGVGANQMGSLGPVIGWPAFMSTAVLGAIGWGFFTGEWKGIHGRPVYLQTGALVVLVAAMFTLGVAARL